MKGVEKHINEIQILTLEEHIKRVEERIADVSKLFEKRRELQAELDALRRGETQIILPNFGLNQKK